VIWLNATSGGQNPRLEIRKRYFLNAALEDGIRTYLNSTDTTKCLVLLALLGRMVNYPFSVKVEPLAQAKAFAIHDQRMRVDSPSLCHHRIPVCRPHVGGVSKGVGLLC
jgi:hypothetical protein